MEDSKLISDPVIIEKENKKSEKEKEEHIERLGTTEIEDEVERDLETKEEIEVSDPIINDFAEEI